MGHKYSSALERAEPVSPGGAYAEMLASATKSISIRSITVTTGSNIGGMIALVRSFGVGTGAATGVGTAVAHRLFSPTTSSRLQVAWTSSGVTPTGYGARFREEVLPVATGQQRVLWDCEVLGPLTVEPGQSLLMVNQASGIQAGAVRLNVTWEEGPARDS